MMPGRPVRVAVVGLGFGDEFIPIYQRHPQAEMVAVCRRDRAGVDEVGDRFGVGKRYTGYRELLRDPDVDAVHINSPIPDHAWMTIEALEAGKHVACTVPMATGVEDCRRIVDVVERTGLRLQFLQTSHMQDMDGWPGYWPGLPPIWYATHCVGPVLALADASAEVVSCFGSGRIREELVEHYGSPFAVETAHVKLRGSDLTARVGRSLFDVARQYRESIDVYGSRRSFEWILTEGGRHVLHTAKRPEPDIPERIEVPDFAERLPKPIRRFTRRGVYDDGETHLSFTQGAGHGGSHPHLVHEFVSALAEQREPFPNARRSANWTCVGLCAHESALKGGELVRLPEFTLDDRRDQDTRRESAR